MTLSTFFSELFCTVKTIFAGKILSVWKSSYTKTHFETTQLSANYIDGSSSTPALILTSMPLCEIGRLNFQSFQDTLKIFPSFFGFGVTFITLNEQNRWVNAANDLLGEFTRFFHLEPSTIICCRVHATVRLRSEVAQFRKIWIPIFDVSSTSWAWKEQCNIIKSRNSTLEPFDTTRVPKRTRRERERERDRERESSCYWTFKLKLSSLICNF